MASTLIPYGLLPNGNYGVSINPLTNDPQASVCEVLTTLPSLANPDNFNGRLVFSLADFSLYVYATTPTPQWKPLQGIPASVGNVAGVPPISPTPQNGELYWDRDTQVLFVWDGAAWKPCGGLFAAQIVENNYIANGILTSYASGAASTIPATYVEVFLDGVRQRATIDYHIVGTAVSFVVAPPSGVVIYVRSLVSESVIQNSQIGAASYIAVGGDTNFSTGQAGSDPAGVFVFVNGVMKTGSGIGYNLVQQDTSITGITKLGPTTARANTTVTHGIPVGATVTLLGFLEPKYNNRSVTVLTTTTNTFTFTVLPTDPPSGTPNPIGSFSPPYLNDVVQFVVPRTASEHIDIRSLRNVVVSGNAGEANTLASIGTGVPLNGVKIGTTLQIKSILAGPNVTVTDLGGSVQIAAVVGQGFEDRVGINAASYTLTGTTSYIGVRNTSTPVTISLAGIAQIPANSGRRVLVLDESGAASTHSITITGGPAKINGSFTAITINNNYGAFELVFDGNDWYIVASRP